ITSISNCNIFNAPTSIDFKVIVKNQLSIKEYGMDNITVYPNPSQDVFIIDGLSANGSFHLKIVDDNGKLVKSESYNSVDSLTIDMRNYSNGNYQIIIETEEKRILKKIIKL
ncbi:MAG TPA: T9SS type A sorting domain-containing protein, partial [Brumimicrobium sp.]|nr:T9SS type A sorting domain-containing protein [Brumimicrobium sp.]